MIPSRWTTRLLLLIVAVSAVAGAACSSSEPEPTLATAPVAFPYIFSGNFTVGGQPGPQGIPMFARLGDGRGLFNETVRPGEYTNVAIAPEKVEDVGGEITFHLGHPDGPTVRANETYVFISSGQPQIIDLDLSFSSLP